MRVGENLAFLESFPFLYALFDVLKEGVETDLPLACLLVVALTGLLAGILAGLLMGLLVELLTGRLVVLVGILSLC